MVVQKFCCGCTLRTGAICAAFYTLFGAVLSLILLVLETHPSLRGRYQVMEYSFEINLIATILEIILSIIGFIALLLAVSQERAALCIPWLVVEGISMAVYVAMIVIYIMAPIVNESSVKFAVIVIIFIELLIKMYFYIVVYSYYKLLKKPIAVRQSWSFHRYPGYTGYPGYQGYQGYPGYQSHLADQPYPVIFYPSNQSSSDRQSINERDSKLT